MKIIFLDVDGVLNNATFLLKKGMDGWPLNHIDESRVALLNQIVEKTDCRIVLSSSWRCKFKHVAFAQLLVEKGFRYPERFIGETPRYGFDNRGMEIAQWIQDNAVMGMTHFVILDDDADMAHLMSNLVQTSWHEGLTPEIAEQVICRLTNHQGLPKVEL